MVLEKEVLAAAEEATHGGNFEDEREEGELSLDDVSSTEEERLNNYMGYPRFDTNRCYRCLSTKICLPWCMAQHAKQHQKRIDGVQGKENRVGSRESGGPGCKGTLQEKNDDLVPISSDSDMDIVDIAESSPDKRKPQRVPPPRRRKKRRVHTSHKHELSPPSRSRSPLVRSKAPAAKSPYRRQKSSPQRRPVSPPPKRTRRANSPKNSRSPVKWPPKSPQRSKTSLHARREKEVSHSPPPPPAPEFIDLYGNVRRLLKRVKRMESHDTKSSLKEKLLGNRAIGTSDKGATVAGCCAEEEELDVELLRQRALQTQQKKSDVADKSLNDNLTLQNSDDQAEDDDKELRMIALRSAMLKKHENRVKMKKAKPNRAERAESPFNESLLYDAEIIAKSPTTSSITPVNGNSSLEDMDLDTDVEREKEEDMPYSPTDEVSESIVEAQLPETDVSIMTPAANCDAGRSLYTPSEPTETPCSSHFRPVCPTEPLFNGIARNLMESDNDDRPYSPTDTPLLDDISEQFRGASDDVEQTAARALLDTQLDAAFSTVDDNIETLSIEPRVGSVASMSPKSSLADDLPDDDDLPTKDQQESSGGSSEPLYLRNLPDVTRDRDKVPTVVDRNLVPAAILKINKQLQLPMPKRSQSLPAFRNTMVQPMDNLTELTEAERISSAFKPIKLSGQPKKPQLKTPALFDSPLEESSVKEQSDVETSEVATPSTFNLKKKRRKLRKKLKKATLKYQKLLKTKPKDDTEESSERSRAEEVAPAATSQVHSKVIEPSVVAMMAVEKSAESSDAVSKSVEAERRRSSMDEDEDALRASALASLARRTKDVEPAKPKTDSVVDNSVEKVVVVLPVTLPDQVGEVVAAAACSSSSIEVSPKPTIIEVPQKPVVVVIAASNLGKRAASASPGLGSKSPAKKIAKKSPAVPASTKILNNAKQLLMQKKQKLMQQKAALEASKKKPVKKFIISLESDSESDVENNQQINGKTVERRPTLDIPTADFEKNLDNFLKDVRHRHEARSVKVATQRSSTLTKVPSPLTKTARVNAPKTTALQHLTVSQQEEYHRLVQQMKELENKKAPASKPQTPPLTKTTAKIISTTNAQTPLTCKSATITGKAQNAAAVNKVISTSGKTLKKIQAPTKSTAVSTLKVTNKAQLPAVNKIATFYTGSPIVKTSTLRIQPTITGSLAKESITPAKMNSTPNKSSSVSAILTKRPQIDEIASAGKSSTPSKAIPTLAEKIKLMSSADKRNPNLIAINLENNVASSDDDAASSLKKVASFGGLKILSRDELNLRVERGLKAVGETEQSTDITVNPQPIDLISEPTITASADKEIAESRLNESALDSSVVIIDERCGSTTTSENTSCQRPIERRQSAGREKISENTDSMDSVGENSQEALTTATNSRNNQGQSKEVFWGQFHDDIASVLKSKDNLTEAEKKAQLLEFENKLVTKRYNVLDDLEEMSSNLKQWEVVKKTQQTLAAEVRKLKEQLRLAEERLEAHKKSSVGPMITASHKKINTGRRECLKLTRLCSGLGQKIHGKTYKVPSVCLKSMNDKLKEVATHTKKILEKKNMSPGESSNDNVPSSMENSPSLTSDRPAPSSDAVESSTEANEAPVQSPATLDKEKEQQQPEEVQAITAAPADEAEPVSVEETPLPKVNEGSTENQNDAPSKKPVKTLEPYESILKHMSNSRNVNPNAIVCPYELMGLCHDAECPYEHHRPNEGVSS